jgi:FdhD protein
MPGSIVADHVADAIRTSEVDIRRLRGDAGQHARDLVAVEAPLELRLVSPGGRGQLVLMRTPGDDLALARGFLYSEGLISGAGDIAAISRPEHLVGDELGNVLTVELRGGKAPVERLFYGSSSCGVCGKNSIAQLAVRAPRVASRLTVAASVLGALPDRLRAAQATFAATGGVHASGLFTPAGELAVVREDVGRHNALDKVIGWALEAGRLPAHDLVLAVSGRTSYEIVQKAIAAGLPVIAGVGAPSSLAVRLAEEFDVTLVGFLRPDGMNVYAGAERVA